MGCSTHGEVLLFREYRFNPLKRVVRRTLWSVSTPKDLADVGLQVVETDLE